MFRFFLPAILFIFPIFCERPLTVIYFNNEQDLPLQDVIARTYENEDTPDALKIKVQVSLIILTIVFFLVPTIFILIHLSRNLPIDHQNRAIHYVQETDAKKLEHAFGDMVKNGALDKASESAFFFFQKWTGYLSTARKLLKTFEQDFDPTKAKLTPEQFAKETNQQVEVMTLTANKILEDDI